MVISMICYPLKKGFYYILKERYNEISLLQNIDAIQQSYIFESIHIKELKESFYRLYDIQLQQENNKLYYENEYYQTIDTIEIYAYYMVIHENDSRFMQMLQRIYPYAIYTQGK